MTRFRCFSILFAFLLLFSVPTYGQGPSVGATITHDSINTTEYVVKIGTDPLLLGGTEYTIPSSQKTLVIENLLYDTTYHAYVKAVGPGGSTTGDIVSLTTPQEPVPPPSKPTLTLEVIVSANGQTFTFKLAEVEGTLVSE